jgi:adenosylmethionine-8-amino-7-oxononanoate aminotransferase
MTAASALNLEHYWMPFTDNRRFKARPKLVGVGAGHVLHHHRGKEGARRPGDASGA